MPQSSPRLTGAPDCPVQPAAPNHNPVSVNDHHSRLNTTQVRRVEHPVSLQALIGVVRRADAHGEPLCIAGGRHAMGGQQFAADAVLVDMTAMDRVLAFDRDRLISGVTLFFRADMALGKRMSLTMGLIGTLTRLIVVGRNIIGTWLTNVLLFELLGAVILLTGVAHILHEIKSRVRTPHRQSSYHFLLGVFECTMGAMLLMSALERGPHIYWPATIWALVGGALILSQALYLRAQRHIQ